MSTPARSGSLRRALTAAAFCAVAFLAANAAPASAIVLAPGDPQFDRARQVAQQTWNQIPCNGQITYRWVDDDPEVNATSHWTTSSPYNTNCSIDFNRNARWSNAKFCTVFAHEIGHLLGHDHAEDAHDLMHWEYTTPLPACEDATSAPPAEQSPDPLIDMAPRTTSRSTSACAKARVAARRGEKRRAAKLRKRCRAARPLFLS